MSARDGRRLLLAHVLTATAMAMPWPALLAEVWSATRSDTWLGVTGAARMLPYVALSAVAGILADRVRRTTVLRWSAGIRAVLLLACAVTLDAGQLGAAVVLAVLTVAAGTPAYPAAVAAMPQLAGAASDRLTRLLVTAEVTAFVVGPAVGGLLLGTGDVAWALPSSVVLSALAIPLLVPLDSGPVCAPAGPVGEGRLRLVLSAPGVPVAIAVVALVNFVEAVASVGMLGLSHQHWGAGDQGFGIGTAALGFGSLAAPLVALLVRLRGSLVLTSTALVLSGAAPGAVAAAAPLALTGAAGTVVECVSTDVLQHAVPDQVRAFSLGLTDSVMVSAAAAGSLLAPYLSTLLGPVATFVALGLLLAAVVVGLARARARTGEPAPATDALRS